jgi:Phospholipase_D-nuclease N-terminal/Right handed beta helix region
MRRLPRALVLVLPLAAVLAAPGFAATATFGAPLAQSGSGVGPGREQPPPLPGATIHVPRDVATIQEAVDRAEPGGLVLISPGVYDEAVVVTTPFLTIRGLDRNGVILDGAFELDAGIHVIEADGVSVENLTIRNYLGDGLVFSSVFGYRASYVTAYNDGDDGLAASGSRSGQIDHAYASGHPGAGISIAACDPCDAVVTDVLAVDNAFGFRGTNAGGALFIANSEWRDNGTGIAADTLDALEDPPERGIVVAGNWVHDNDNVEAPTTPLASRSFGIGIAVIGARGAVVTQNLVEGHAAFGIAILPSADGGLWLTQDDEIRDNVVGDSGRADLVLGAPAAGGDCFSGNAFGTSLPPAIEWRHGCASPLRAAAGGSFGADIGPLTRLLDARDDVGGGGDWRSQPPPPPQPQMPDARSAPPAPATADVAVPQPIHIRDARTLDVRASAHVSQEVLVLGSPLAAGWLGLLVGLYAYALPLILYSTWISIALWDLVRQDAVPNRVRIGWMAAIIVVPLIGPIAYYAFGRSPIQGSLRLALVAGGLGVYLVLAALGVALGS